jgi:hypothetical protein
MTGGALMVDGQHALRLQLMPGNYTLRVIQRGATWMPLVDACVPLVLDVQVAPASAPGYVRAVLPPGAQDLPPDVPLSVSMVLSAPPMSRTGQPITPCVACVSLAVSR